MYQTIPLYFGRKMKMIWKESMVCYGVFLTIIVVQNNLDPNSKSHVQRFSHFETPIKYQYPLLSYLTSILMLINHTVMHSTIHQSNIGLGYPIILPVQHRVRSKFWYHAFQIHASPWLEFLELLNVLIARNCNVSDCQKNCELFVLVGAKCKGRPPCASRVQEWPPGFSSHKGIDLIIGVMAKSLWVPLTKLSGSRTMPACRKSRQPTVAWHWNGVWFPSLSTPLFFFVSQSILHALSSMNVAP